jgi:hypothetical protein
LMSVISWLQTYFEALRALHGQTTSVKHS